MKKFVYTIDMNKQKIGKISISKDLSTDNIEQLFIQIIDAIKRERGEDDDDIDIPTVELDKEWR